MREKKARWFFLVFFFLQTSRGLLQFYFSEIFVICEKFKCARNSFLSVLHCIFFSASKEVHYLRIKSESDENITQYM